MSLRQRTTLLAIACLLGCCLYAQAYRHTTTYDEHDGMAQGHVTQMLQDRDGFMWLSTWNGLDRFDGRDFVNFKTKAGDGCDMPSDRIRDLRLLPEDAHALYCRVDERWYRFSLFTERFSAISDARNRYLHTTVNTFSHYISTTDSIRFRMTDRQGNVWLILPRGIRRVAASSPMASRLALPQDSEVKSIFVDRKRRYWIASKNDSVVRIYNSHHQLLGYLTPQGSLSKTYTPFVAPIYCIYQSRNGDMWLGSKPGGLFHLMAQGGGFRIEHYRQGDRGLNSNAVYDIREDRYGRLWLATMGGGINCLSGNRFTHHLFGQENRARRIYLRGDTLLATTTEGLVTMLVNGKSKVFVNRKEAWRASSLSCSACMSIIDYDGRLFIATESGGVNELLSHNLLSSHLLFKHYDKTSGLSSDIVLAMSRVRDKLLLVSTTQLMTLDPKTGEAGYLGQYFFRDSYLFSDASPVRLADGTWLFGLIDGACSIAEDKLEQRSFVPPLALTGITIENEPTRYTVNHLDSVTLTPGQRTLMVTFAALDYRAPENIRYAYKMTGDADWHFLHSNHSITLPELAPGTYHLLLRSTNAEGRWADNTRTLTIVVKPRFVETVWFVLLMVFLLLGLVAAALCTVRYIRRIKRQQRETLEAYLTLLESSKRDTDDKPQETSEPTPAQPAAAKLSPDDEAFMERVMLFVQQHIDDADASIADMADATATSKSGLNRKMKSLVGLTPADFLREARIKHACQLLRETGQSISDIAYACGFTDPKYFGKCFRNTLGCSPSEYRNRH